MRKHNCIEHFLELNCAGDVLNSFPPSGNMERKIRTAICMVDKIRGLVEKYPGRFVLCDISPHPLFAILASHILPVRETFYISNNTNSQSNEERYAQYAKRTRNFTYVRVYEDMPELDSPSDVIITSVDPTRNIAKFVANHFITSPARRMFMCFDANDLDNYNDYLTYDIYDKVGGKVEIGMSNAFDLDFVIANKNSNRFRRKAWMYNFMVDSVQQDLDREVNVLTLTVPKNCPMYFPGMQITNKDTKDLPRRTRRMYNFSGFATGEVV